MIISSQKGILKIMFEYRNRNEYSQHNTKHQNTKSKFYCRKDIPRIDAMISNRCSWNMLNWLQFPIFYYIKSINFSLILQFILVMTEQNIKLQGIIKGILSSIKETAEFCEEVSMIAQLTKLAILNPDLNEFQRYIIKQFDVPSNIIYSMVDALCLDPVSKTILGSKLLRLWIKYRFFYIMDIFKKPEKDKREKINKFIISFDFNKQNIKDFIFGCLKEATGKNLSMEQIQGYKEKLIQGRNLEDFSIIFCPEVVQAAYNPDKSIEESFIDMVADFRYFPQGSIEHSLQRELLLSFLQKNEKQLRQIANRYVPDLINSYSKIRELEDIFKEKLGFISGDNAQLFRKMGTDEDQKERYESLCALKATIMTINVLQLQRLINKTNVAKASIRKKNVLFVMGTTGSGKSTNILRFLGYTLKLATFNALKTLIPVQKLKQEHRTFYTSPEAKSCTRYINSVPIPDSMYKKGTASEKKNLVICDSPGFGDNAGIEVDIANGVGMINALYDAASVRVVVLLSYDALVSTRMKGAIQIGEIISNLFHDFSQVLDSIVFLFNKVPKDQKSQIPKLIQNKFENLTTIEKSNEKLRIFFKELQEQSKQESNFIYPLQSDYKQIFTSISSKPPITAIKKNFRYDFTASTKKEITNYVQIQKGKIKDFFNSNNFAEARFHFELLKKINDILSDDKIQEIYTEICKYIGDRSRYQLKQFESIFVQIENGQENSRLRVQLKQAKEKIADINKYFNHFEGLKVISELQIKQITEKFKQKLTAKAKDPTNLNKRYKKAVEIFSDQIDPEFKEKVLKSVSLSLSQELHELRFFFDQSKFLQMAEGTKKCKNIADFISSINSQHRSLQQYNEFISLISEKSITILMSLKEISSEDIKPAIIKRDSNKPKEKLQQLSAINSLDIAKVEPSLKEQMSNVVKAISNKCKKYIRELEGISLQNNLEVKEHIKSNDERIITAMKNEIQFLMDISPNIKQDLEIDYNYAKQSISKKVKENAEMLNEFINGLKTNKMDNIQRTMTKIKEATKIVIKCSQLVDNQQNPQKTKKLISSIIKEFLNYLQKYKKSMIKEIDFQLNQIDKQILDLIQQKSNNIANYFKMADIDQGIKNEVTKLSDQFNIILINPFVSFNKAELPYLESKDEYRRINFFWERLQKLCYYTVKVKGFLSAEKLLQLKKEEVNLQVKLKPHINKMMEQSNTFIKQESSQNIPEYLKDLIKTLISLSQKQYTCKYIYRYFSFDISQAIQSIKGQLQQIKEKLEKEFTISLNRPDKVQELLSLLQTIKFYISVEEPFKYQEEYLKIGFDQLYDKINKHYIQNIKNDQDKIKGLIQAKSTEMQWQDINEIYKRLNLQKSSKIQQINKQLLAYDSSLHKKLEQFTKQIAPYPEGIRAKAWNDINVYFDSLKEAVELQRELNILFAQKDSKRMKINDRFLQKVGRIIFEIFLRQYSYIDKMIHDYDIYNVKILIINFNKFQQIVQSLFTKQSKEQKEVYDNLSREIIIKIEEIKKNVHDEILKFSQKHPYAAKEELKYSEFRTLSDQLSIFRSLTQQLIKIKYLQNPQNLKIDEQFKKYFKHLAKDNNQNIKQIRQHVIINIDHYFNNQMRKYKQSQSEDETNDLEQRIKNSMKNLPYDSMKEKQKDFNTLKDQMKQEANLKVKTLSQQILKGSQNLNNYFEQAYRAKIKGQKSLHLLFIVQLDKIMEKMSHSFSQQVQKKCKFIKDYLIDSFKKYNKQLEDDQQMKKKLKNRLQIQLKTLLQALKQTARKLKQIFQRQNEEDKVEKANLHSIAIVSSLSLLQYSGNIQHSMLLVCVQDCLQKICDVFNEKAQKRPIENLLSKDMLDEDVSRKLQNYIDYINCNGIILDKIKGKILSHPNCGEIPKIVDKYSKIENYTKFINFYKDQILRILNQFQDYEFCDNRTRNMNYKQLQASLSSVDSSLQILQMREDLFNKYILQEKSRYTASKISSRFRVIFDSLKTNSKSEVEDIFKDYNSPVAYKINLIIDILNIMRDKKLKMISLDIVNRELNELEQFVKGKFQSIKIECTKKLDAAKQIFLRIRNDIKELEKKKDGKIIEQKEKCKEQIEAGSNKITQQIDDKLQYQYDENNIKNLQNSKKTNIATFTNGQKSKLTAKIGQIESQFKVETERLQKERNKSRKEFTDSLILFKKVLLDIKYMNQKNTQIFDLILSQIPKNGPKFIKFIEEGLCSNQNDQYSIGQVLLTTNKIFANYMNNMIKRLVQGKDIDYVLENLKKIKQVGREQLPLLFKKNVRECYITFRVKYEEYKNLYKNSPSESTIIQIATKCKDIGIHLKNDFYQSQYPTIGNKSQLLAGIFALWAILKSQKFEEEVEWMMQPHPTQITALILLLGIVYDEEHLDNRLAQVGTGEGKSVVLAGLSCYLALVGFKVRCACYSSYLSGRDQTSFMSLFERLGVQKEIKYGTFNQLCEDILNGNGTNFKEKVTQMILKQPQRLLDRAASFFGFNLVSLNRGQNEIINNPTILVIDEVDVFFEDSFFGNSYCPAMKLRDPTVSNFLQFVFSEVSKHGNKTDIQELFQSDEFMNLVGRYPNLQGLLKNQVHGMVAGALAFKHDYFIIDKKIVYKDNDSISHNISYGYKTVFANIYEHSRNNVSFNNLNEALQITLMIAEFSYALLPNYFQNILGVTGTLQVLPQYKKRQLSERYQIFDQYAIPSAFGLNNRRVDNYAVVPEANLHKTIVQKIDLVRENRPIIIFFSNSRELNEFFLSPLFEPFQSRTSNLTEEHQASVRDSRIIRAVNQNVITLMTNSFGRGTDFVIVDQKIKDNGGLHIIQCFLSLDESEEVQIKGRTARQSNSGSYDCILSENWLEQINLKKENVPYPEAAEVIHNTLLDAREARINRLAQTTLKILEEADRKHDMVVKIYQKQMLAQKQLIQYIQQINRYPQITDLNIKTILGIDGTGSMGWALKKTCEICSISFERAYKVLEDNNVKASIEIKIIIYRNYNSPYEQIIESTAFENTAPNLKRFLDNVEPKGGWGNEAMQVLFQAINREQFVDQVILIGDAAQNTPEQISKKRGKRGELYWNKNGFYATNMTYQLNKFKARKAPVHSFYLGADAAFKNISTYTRGIAAPFNIKSQKVSDELTAFIVEQILAMIEKKDTKGGLKLVQSYRKMFS